MNNLDLLNNFPSYTKKLSSFERCRLGYEIIPNFKLGCCFSYTGHDKDFDKKLNHKPYDEAGIPREIKQPVDFEI